MKLTRYQRSRPFYPRFCLLYAEKGGGPVLREESAWHKVNGVRWSLRGRTVVLTFRRDGS